MRPLSEVYDTYPDARDGLVRELPDALSQGLGSLAIADQMINYPDPADFLDELSSAGDAEEATRDFMVSALKHLPPRVIAEEYGLRSLLWLFTHAPRLSRSEALASLYLMDTGMEMLLVDRATTWAGRDHGRDGSRSAEVLGQYNLMHSLGESKGLSKIDIAQVVRDHAKPGISLSEKHIAQYGLIPLRADGLTPDGSGREVSWYHTSYTQPQDGIWYQIYLDTPCGFALTDKGKPIAVAGLSSDGKELMIRQLQGVRAYKIDPTTGEESGRVSARGLITLDWEGLLVEVTRQLAADLGMESVGIQEAEKCRWTRPQFNEAEAHLSKEQAVARYDEQAKRLEFSRGADGDWHKSLANS